MISAKRVAAILAVNLLLLAAGVVAVELVFGGWLDARHLNRLNLIKDHVYRHEVSSLYQSDKPLITYSRDKYGLRGAYAAPDRIRILTLGGSTTDQRFIGDGQTWQDALQRQFARAGLAVPVANAGVDGQSTFGHIADFKWWFPDIPGLAPEFILFYVGINDFHIDAAERFDRLVSDGTNPSIAERIRENSAIWNLYKTLRGIYKALVVSRVGHQRVRFDQIRWAHEPEQKDYGFMAPRLDAYASRLRLLADLTREMGATPIFVSQPTRHYRITPRGIEGWSDLPPYDGRGINGIDVFHMMRKLDEVAQAVAAEKGALYVDLAKRDAWVDLDFYDFVHMTPQGAAKVGLFLYEALKDSVAPERKRVARHNQASGR
jgi:lysophospholipase L1-like esterase